MRSIKSYIQAALSTVGLHQRLKVSRMYDLYWRVVDRELINGRKREMNFYRNLLQGFSPGDLIFDIGANAGEKTDLFLRLGARVLAVEPDDFCRQIIKGKFHTFRLARKPVEILGKALSDRNAVEMMWISAPGSALNTLSHKWVDALAENEERFSNKTNNCQFAAQREVETTTLEDLIVAKGLPFFVKIDVEGYEWSVIRGMRRPVPYLSFEVNLPEFREEGIKCIQSLESLSPDGRFNYTGDCQRGLTLSQWQRPSEFIETFGQCTEKCIEVFWKTPIRNR